MVVSLSILGGFALGIGTMTASGGDDTAPATSPDPSVAALAALPPSATGFPELGDDPATAVYEPFAACSADYANGPGAELDRNNMIGPENSVLLSPEEMMSRGYSAAQIDSQSRAWNKLSPEEREEQLCRAAQQNAAIAELR
ncbi:hypothetical protein [Arthrobacter gallicola]|nr:hypothetical protein [Arthrobacter gallicola]